MIEIRYRSAYKGRKHPGVEDGKKSVVKVGRLRPIPVPDIGR